MPAAARRPSPIARMTVAAPRTMSPPAKTPGMEVMPVFSSTSTCPFLSTFSSGVVAAMSGFAPEPTATMTVWTLTPH